MGNGETGGCSCGAALWPASRLDGSRSSFSAAGSSPAPLIHGSMASPLKRSNPADSGADGMGSVAMPPISSERSNPADLVSSPQWISWRRGKVCSGFSGLAGRSAGVGAAPRIHSGISSSCSSREADSNPASKSGTSSFLGARCSTAAWACSAARAASASTRRAFARASFSQSGRTGSSSAVVFFVGNSPGRMGWLSSGARNGWRQKEHTFWPGGLGIPQ